MLRRLQTLTWEAAIPPAVCALLNLALFVSMESVNAIHVAFNVLTPRLYVFSVMHSLNSRATIRTEQATSYIFSGRQATQTGEIARKNVTTSTVEFSTGRTVHFQPDEESSGMDTVEVDKESTSPRSYSKGADLV